MHVRVHQTKCTLASLTDNEMFWKHHWTWHDGPRQLPPSGDSGSAVSPIERRMQSTIDRLPNQLNNQGFVNGKKRRGGRGWQQGKGKQQYQGGGGKGQAQLNTNIPPLPGKEQSAGQKAFANRKKFNKGKGKK